MENAYIDPQALQLWVNIFILWNHYIILSLNTYLMWWLELQALGSLEASSGQTLLHFVNTLIRQSMREINPWRTGFLKHCPATPETQWNNQAEQRNVFVPERILESSLFLSPHLRQGLLFVQRLGSEGITIIKLISALMTTMQHFIPPETPRKYLRIQHMTEHRKYV